MRAAQHGKSVVLWARSVDYERGRPWVKVEDQQKVGAYGIEAITTIGGFDVMAGETCVWYPDGAFEQWLGRMEAEYGSRESWQG